uniref:Uncharacterized protein n=1 Tax=Anguilla anguilla TaxID=7936 RepID=A0A0E9TUH9_ANGAN
MYFFACLKSSSLSWYDCHRFF